MYERLIRMADRWGGTISFLLSALVCIYFFYPYYAEPNKLMLAFGGDALAIYYNLIYHVCHDTSPMLTGLNYPHGEYIFMTDAQGALAEVLRKLQGMGVDTCSHVFGIVHLMIFILLPLTSVPVFFILRRLGVSPIISVFSSVLIALLSPQMMRIEGHYGLSYPFIIPLFIVWLLRKYEHADLEWRDGFLMILLSFFTFNNPYVGFSSSLICFMFGGVSFLFLGFKKGWKFGLVGGLMPIAIVALTYLNFKLNDPVTDRVIYQKGFFFYHATLDGSFFPHNSIIYHALTSYGVKLRALEFEALQNLGVVASLTVLLMVYLALVNLFKQNKQTILVSGHPGWKYMIIGSLLLYLFAANSSIFGFLESFMEKYLGELLMFKASARLAWPTYFVITCTVVLFLEQAIKKLNNPPFQRGFWFFILLIWGFEVRTYVFSRYENSFHPNFFSEEKEEEIRSIFREHNIDPDDYQAIYVLPRMMAWTDKFFSNFLWSSHFFSTRIAAAFAKPIVPATLSRMSIGQSAETIEMMAHPLIKRSLPDKFPDKRNLLIVHGGEGPPLEYGERFLLEISDTLYVSGAFSLYSLSLEALNNNAYRDEADKVISSGYSDPPLYRHGFDSGIDTIAYGFGKAQLLPVGTHTILNWSPENWKDTSVIVSAWTHFDNKRAGLGTWIVKVKNAEGGEVFRRDIDNRYSNDIHDDWVRMEVEVPLKSGEKIEIDFWAEAEMLISDLQIDLSGHDNVFLIPANNKVLFNNIRLD